MKVKLLLVFGLIFLFFALNEVSAYHPSNWDLANEYYKLRMPHNRMYDYFKYGSPWQGDVVVDVTYSDPPRYYPRRVAMPRNYRPHYYYGYPNYNYLDYDYKYDKKYSKKYSYKKYRNYPAVKNCGYDDGYYGNCY